MHPPIPVAERSKARVYGRSLTGIAGSNPAGGMHVLCIANVVLSGRGLCDGPIPRPEESYRLWCVSVCDLQTSRMRRSCPTLGCWARNKHKNASEQTPLYLEDAIGIVEQPVTVRVLLSKKALTDRQTIHFQLTQWDVQAQNSTVRFCNILAHSKESVRRFYTAVTMHRILESFTVYFMLFLLCLWNLYRVIP